MTTHHDSYLELAAAGIDFELTQAEREALAQHLDGCDACRRRVAGLHDDQRALAQLPRYVRPAAGAGLDRPRARAQMPALRLVAIAAMLALLALGALTVGASLLHNDRTNLTFIPPTVTDPVATPRASPGPSATPKPGAFPAGSVVEVVVTGLRVRTAPTVDDAVSAKLEPLLGPGTQLQVIDGPVTADGYDWYLIQAIGFPHRGWVAVADHDGAPWVEDQAALSSPAPDFTADEAALVAGLRTDAAVHCAPRRTDLPVLAVAGVECRLETAIVARVGVYRFGGDQDATATYLERLASYAVAPATGDCAGGTAGDSAWMPGDGSPGTIDPQLVLKNATGSWAVGRTGCFLDENGTANVRATCGSTYLGILGRTSDLAALYGWVWRSEGGTTEPSTPPGICRLGAPAAAGSGSVPGASPSAR